MTLPANIQDPGNSASDPHATTRSSQSSAEPAVEFYPNATVRVTFLDNGKMHMEPSSLSIEPGVIVTWNFLNVPLGFAPYLRFGDWDPQGDSAPGAGQTYPGPQFGPFEGLIHTRNKIIGLGHHGELGSFTWEVLLVPKLKDPTGRPGAGKNERPSQELPELREPGTFVSPPSRSRLGTLSCHANW